MPRTRRPAHLTLCTLAATAVLALTTVTACGSSNSGAKTSGKADTSVDGGQQAQDSKDGQVIEDGGQNDSTASAASDQKGGPKGGQKNDKSGGKGGKSACTAADVKIEAQPVRSPINHMLLVATNTSKATCHAYGFPYLRFDLDQATAGVVEESKAQSVTTLAPGKSAYAAVILSAADGSAGPGREAKKLSVSFQGPNGGGSIGGQASVTPPGGAVHVDDSARVTYWTTDSAAALKW
ncbi:DUF4232 domain-containing protein [Streptomyces sp. UNOC14_S4]|uniref:DUF4232 domain-containing protein n=1 Tax=Streptomyces sp. UNOC14_S4 TaxID=2872340 RepID=UPI001E374105|nr:DUF4232 domain-containing protein [Streptomyces sp. UNOC14_S4]MCC3766400.1 DUF4232 domain-containing protein [Streptomyces sp. UNOC14_S4]